MKFFLLFALVVQSVYSRPSDLRISCRNENDEPIDWFSIIKFPTQSGNTFSELIRGGVGHTFITNRNQEWSFSRRSLASNESFPGRTLDVLYKTDFNESNIGYIMYNDQFDHRELASRAHAKGVIIFDDKSAVWLVHSIPDYPPRPSSKRYDIGGGQRINGQSMICLTLPFEALEQVGKQLFLIWPQLYDTFIPNSLASNPVLANLVEVTRGRRAMVAPWTNVESIKTVGNAEFIALHKHTNFGDDIYPALMGRYFRTKFLSETWSRGVGVRASNCTFKFPVNNIREINFRRFQTSYRVTTDHSKWAVSVADEQDSSSPKIVCIGDINRMLSQTRRGGGSICFNNNVQVWREFNNVVNEVEPCPVIQE